MADPFTRIVVLHDGTVRFDGSIGEFRRLGSEATDRDDPAAVALARATVR